MVRVPSGTLQVRSDCIHAVQSTQSTNDPIRWVLTRMEPHECGHDKQGTGKRSTLIESENDMVLSDWLERLRRGVM